MQSFRNQIRFHFNSWVKTILLKKKISPRFNFDKFNLIFFFHLTSYQKQFFFKNQEKVKSIFFDKMVFVESFFFLEREK